MKPSRRRVEHEPGFVLHSYAYKETSLVLEAFSQAHGRVALMARGARRPRSALRGVLMAFQPLRLSWTGIGELCNLTSAEWSGGQAVLGGAPLMSGFYLNELLMRLLPREDPHETLFAAYAAGVARLSAGAPPAAVLRSFERRLLAELGYAVLLERDVESGAAIEAGRMYRYDPERGPTAANGAGGELRVSGKTLLDIASDDYARAETREEARELMRALIAHRLGNQKLHTRSVMMELQEL
jgi:DNA repair protein RecO (recombination protein O)